MLYRAIDTVMPNVDSQGKGRGNSNTKQIMELEEPNSMGERKGNVAGGSGRIAQKRQKQCESRPEDERRKGVFENWQMPPSISTSLGSLCCEANLQCLSFSKLRQHILHAANRLSVLGEGTLQPALLTQIQPNRI